MGSIGSENREKDVLELWERAVGLDRWQRDDKLLTLGPAPPRGLGARNAALLARRSMLFDRAWLLRSRCPACLSECEFEVDSMTLAEDLSAQANEGAATFEWAGRSVTARAPDVDDLNAISRQTDQASAVRALLGRCLTGDVDLANADHAEIEELGA